MNKKMMIPLFVAMILLTLVPAVFAADIEVDFTGVGVVDIYVEGTDTSSWNPGSLGQSNRFYGSGDFTLDYDSNFERYGSLNTYVNAYTTTGANFYSKDYMDFDILSANHNNNVEGVMESWASGTNAEMNQKYIGSMVVWSEATNPYWEPCLQGQYIEKYAQVFQSSVLQGYIDLAVTTDGTATMSNSNIWGWGISEGAGVTSDYGSGTRTVSATGSGTYDQHAFGLNYLEFNGIVLNTGGYGDISGGFVGGISTTYSMDGN